MNKVLELRHDAINKQKKEAVKISVNDIIVKAVALSFAGIFQTPNSQAGWKCGKKIQTF